MGQRNLLSPQIEKNAFLSFLDFMILICPFVIDKMRIIIVRSGARCSVLCGARPSARFDERCGALLI